MKPAVNCSYRDVHEHVANQESRITAGDLSPNNPYVKHAREEMLLAQLMGEKNYDALTAEPEIPWNWTRCRAWGDRDKTEIRPDGLNAYEQWVIQCLFEEAGLLAYSGSYGFNSPEETTRRNQFTAHWRAEHQRLGLAEIDSVESFEIARTWRRQNAQMTHG